ncbi:hypothetical protein S40285_10904, partial [Stachybotrys chlorohalonatus IBT 40285]
GGL